MDDTRIDVSLSMREFDFIRDLIQDELENFYDDPYGETLQDARDTFHRLESLSVRFNLDLGLVRDSVTEFEKRRMDAICNPSVTRWREVNAVV